MSHDKYVKDKDYQHRCPFCKTILVENDDKYFSNHGCVGYECPTCHIPGAITKSGKSYSAYNIGVMKDLRIGESIAWDQVITEETFYIHYRDHLWYNVTNNLAKQQTVMVMVAPMKEEHVVYADETPIGLVWLSELVVLPFIDSWDLSDQAATISKIRTYLLFM